MLTTVLESIDTFVLIATTSSSITLSLRGISLIVVPILTGRSCGLTISNNVIYEINVRKYSQEKKQNQKINKLLNL